MGYSPSEAAKHSERMVEMSQEQLDTDDSLLIEENRKKLIVVESPAKKLLNSHYSSAAASGGELKSAEDPLDGDTIEDVPGKTGEATAVSLKAMNKSTDSMNNSHDSIGNDDPYCNFTSEEDYQSVHEDDDSESDDNPRSSFNLFQSPSGVEVHSRQSENNYSGGGGGIGGGSGSKPSQQVVKCCFENQRFWLMKGWTASMGGSLERASWSDAQGVIYLPKKSIKLEKGWRWATEWQVEGREVRGSQSNSLISVVNPDENAANSSSSAAAAIPVKDHDGTYDAQGWQYSDRFGNNFSGHQKTLDFVRRRKWVRVAIRCNNNELLDVEKKKSTVGNQKQQASPKLLNLDSTEPLVKKTKVVNSGGASATRFMPSEQDDSFHDARQDSCEHTQEDSIDQKSTQRQPQLTEPVPEKKLLTGVTSTEEREQEEEEVKVFE